MWIVLILGVSACTDDASQLSGAALIQRSAGEASADLQAQSEGALQVDYYAPTGVARWVAAEGGIITEEFSGQNLGAEGEKR